MDALDIALTVLAVVAGINACVSFWIAYMIRRDFLK